MKKLDPRVRLLMLSGAKDEIIPPRHMRELWNAACGLEAEHGTERETSVKAGGAAGSGPNASGKQTNAKKKKEPARWTRFHLDLLAKLRLRTHRREESVASAIVPKAAPRALDTPSQDSSTEKAKSRLASGAGEVRKNDGGNGRKGKFISVAAGTHSEFLLS